jgi:hypothetical protein
MLGSDCEEARPIHFFPEVKTSVVPIVGLAFGSQWQELHTSIESHRIDPAESAESVKT